MGYRNRLYQKQLKNAASPNASKNAMELIAKENLDIADITGTGVNGKVTIRDVNNFLKEKAVAQSAYHEEEE